MTAPLSFNLDSMVIRRAYGNHSGLTEEVMPLQQFKGELLEGYNQPYTPTTPTDWAMLAPLTVGEALDRLAAVIKVLNTGTGA